ncbi:MAG: transposase [Deltaproteobacteria bacterium]|nr:transposase [Deltaproteobacteria bacterium]
MDFSRPGKPTDTCFIETFNGSLRDECLKVHWFETVEEAKARIEAWRRDYNESRPHRALREQTPAEFAAKTKELEGSMSLETVGNQRLMGSGAPSGSPCLDPKNLAGSIWGRQVTRPYLKPRTVIETDQAVLSDTHVGAIGVDRWLRIPGH